MELDSNFIKTLISVYGAGMSVFFIIKSLTKSNTQYMNIMDKARKYKSVQAQLAGNKKEMYK